MDILYPIVKGLRYAFTIYGWMHILAFLFSWIHADPRNGFVMFIHRYTLPLWGWVEARVSYSWRFFAPYLALMLVFFLEIFVPGTVLSLGAFVLQDLELSATLVSILAYAGIAAATVTSHLVSFILILSIIWFILTLTNPAINNPLVRSVMMMIDPFITPIQRILPRGNIDLSPLVVALLAYFGNQLIQVAIFQMAGFVAI